MYHTDDVSGAHISGTAVNDTMSVMQSGNANHRWTGWTYNDSLALTKLYPRVHHFSFCTGVGKHMAFDLSSGPVSCGTEIRNAQNANISGKSLTWTFRNSSIVSTNFNSMGPVSYGKTWIVAQSDGVVDSILAEVIDISMIASLDTVINSDTVEVSVSISAEQGNWEFWFIEGQEGALCWEENPCIAAVTDLRHPWDYDLFEYRDDRKEIDVYVRNTVTGAYAHKIYWLVYEEDEKGTSRLKLRS